MAFGLKCPECRKTFRYKPADGHPRFCPLCNADIAGEEKDDTIVSIPAFLSSKSKANDQLYREFERSSEARQEQAAALAGVDKADMADLKVTNMNSTLHEGAIAAVPIQNAVTAQMDYANSRGGKFGFTDRNGAEFSAGVATGAITVDGKVTQGIAPRAGANTLAKIQGLYNR